MIKTIYFFVDDVFLVVVFVLTVLVFIVPATLDVFLVLEPFELLATLDFLVDFF